MKKFLVLIILLVAVNVYAAQVTINIPDIYITYVQQRASQQDMTAVQYLLKIIRNDYKQYKSMLFQAEQREEYNAYVEEQQAAYYNYLIGMESD